MDSDSYPGTKGFELILSHSKTVIFFVTPAAYARQEFKNCQVILLSKYVTNHANLTGFYRVRNCSVTMFDIN